MTSPPSTVVLDTEAVQALADPHHRKHRRALAVLEVANQRNGRRRQAVIVLVPVAVRVEAGWQRSSPSAVTLNRISRAKDDILDSSTAERATALGRDTGVSVVDATVGAAAERAVSPVAIVTSEIAGMQRLAGLMETDVRVVHL